MITQTPAPVFVTTQWYYYADTKIEYVCRFDPESKVPDKFYGPHESAYAASVAYREWKLEQMESDDDDE